MKNIFFIKNELFFFEKLNKHFILLSEQKYMLLKSIKPLMTEFIKLFE